MSILDASYAAYLMLLLAVIFDVLFFWLKRAILAILSVFGWAGMGFYAFTVSASDATVNFLGLFCMVAALANIVLMIAVRPKKEELPVKTSQQESEEYISHLRAMRYGRLSGYDKEGNKTGQDW